MLRLAEMEIPVTRKLEVRRVPSGAIDRAGCRLRDAHDISRWAAPWLLWALLTIPSAGRAQQAVVSVTGHIVAQDAIPLGNLDVQLQWSAGGVDSVRIIRLDRDGRFRVEVPRDAEHARIRIASARFVTRELPVATGSGPGPAALGEIRLTAKAQALPRVQAVGPRPKPSRNDDRLQPRPGERVANIDAALAFNGDLLGDPSDALSAIPGIQVLPDPSGGPPQLTVAGLSPALNRSTINGMPSADNPPRDAGVLQILLNSYDPARASSSLVTNWAMLSANFLPVRRLHGTVSSPATEWTSAAGDHLGARVFAPVLSGTFAGPGRGPVRMINGSFQASTQRSVIPSVLSAAPASLAPLGLTPATVNALRTRLPGLGINFEPSQKLARQTTQASLYTRLDFTTRAIAVATSNADGTVSVADGGTDGDATYLVLGGNLNHSRGPGASASALPFYGTSTDYASAVLQGVWSHFTRTALLSESRLGVTVGSRRSGPTSQVPGATVLMGSASLDSSTFGTGIALLGGSASIPVRDWDVLIHGANETRWKTRNGRHEFEVAFEGSLERLTTTRDASAGTFTFASLNDYLANSPTSFVRRLGRSQITDASLGSAVGIGDTYRPSKFVNVQYGLRVERAWLTSDAPHLASVDSVFGRDTRALPQWLAVSPMVGLTWILGRDAGGFADASRRITAGVRDYRASLPLSTIATRPQRVGTTAANILRCVGGAVQPPDWRGLVSGTMAAPAACLDGNSTETQLATDADVFNPAFTVAHSWRADAALDYSFPGRLFTTLHTMFAVNTAQSLPVDLNFSGIQRGVLSAEGNRPLFVAPNSVAPNSGAIAPTESRRDPQFGAINEYRTASRGHAQSIGLTASYRPSFSFFSSGIQTPLTIDYTFASSERRWNGFTATTAGDPLKMESIPDPYSRHTILISGGVRVPDVAMLSVGIQLRSGFSFTPTVLNDINGDGLANDRAFIFDPTTAVSNVAGLASWFASAPGSIRQCLRLQVGRIARPNSCEGPWSSTINAALTLDSYRLRIQNRGSVRIVFSNLAAGADLLLHGANDTRGWGQIAYPDPVLLIPRGFDPSTSAFRYSVNPRFGSSDAIRAVLASPFRISLDVSFDVGQSPEVHAMESRLNASTEDTSNADLIASRLAWHGPALFDDLMKLADSLKLSRVQLDSLSRWSDEHTAYRDSLYRELAKDLAVYHGNYASRRAQEHWHDAISMVRWHEWGYRSKLIALLTPAQRRAAFSERSPAVSRLLLMDRDEATRFLARWFYAPG